MPFPGSKSQGVLAAKPPPKLEEPARDTEGDPAAEALGEDKSAESCQATDGPDSAAPVDSAAPAGIAPPAAINEGDAPKDPKQGVEPGGAQVSEELDAAGSPASPAGGAGEGDEKKDGAADDSEPPLKEGESQNELGDPAADVKDAPEDDASEDGTSPLAGAGEVEEPKASEADIQVERVRLKEVVHTFVGRALGGAPCTLLAEAGRTAAKYCLDHELETMSLVAQDDMSHTLISCRIAHIEDVYCIADDGPGPFPPPILAMLKPEEQQAVLMVVFRGPQNKLFRFCILDESDKTCAMFMEAMSCLHMYAQPQSETLRKEVAEEHSKLNGSEDKEGDLACRVASRAADAALAQQASVGFFLRCAGVPGGKGPFGALMTKARKLSRRVAITPLPKTEVPAYLAGYGFAAQSSVLWRTVPALSGVGALPQLGISVLQHIEVAGHTWYMVECSLLMQGSQRHQRLDWQVPRRLAHLRQDLHDPVKAAMGRLYQKYFSGTRFARAGGMPGTTAALHNWCTRLAQVLKSGGALPSVVALVLRFLEAPNPELPGEAAAQ